MDSRWRSGWTIFSYIQFLQLLPSVCHSQDFIDRNQEKRLYIWRLGVWIRMWQVHVGRRAGSGSVSVAVSVAVMLFDRKCQQNHWAYTQNIYKKTKYTLIYIYIFKKKTFFTKLALSLLSCRSSVFYSNLFNLFSFCHELKNKTKWGFVSELLKKTFTVNVKRTYVNLSYVCTVNIQ